MNLDVLAIGGDNAALLTARKAGASILLHEAAPREWSVYNCKDRIIW